MTTTPVAQDSAGLREQTITCRPWILRFFTVLSTAFAAGIGYFYLRPGATFPDPAMSLPFRVSLAILLLGTVLAQWCECFPRLVVNRDGLRRTGPTGWFLAWDDIALVHPLRTRWGIWYLNVADRRRRLAWRNLPSSLGTGRASLRPTIPTDEAAFRQLAPHLKAHGIPVDDEEYPF